MEAIFMDVHEAIKILQRDVSVYFYDNSTDSGIEQLREDYLPYKSRPHWSLIKSAFEVVLEQCTEIEMNELVENKFNMYIPLLPEGARGFLTQIYKSVFEVE
jgi:hypothetical protein